MIIGDRSGIREFGSHQVRQTYDIKWLTSGGQGGKQHARPSFLKIAAQFFLAPAE